MGQRINIQYTIEIDELEEEVRRLIVTNVSNFETIIEKIRGAYEDNVLTHNTIEDLDLIRQEMARVDMRMLDCVNIIEGYLQYKSGSQNDALSTELLEQIDPLEEFSALKEKIGKFKESEANEVSD